MPELINRRAFEKALSERLSAILMKARRNLVDAIYHEGFTQGELSNIPPDILRELQDDLTRELQQQIPPVFIDTARDYAGLLSFALDEGELQRKAQTWAGTFIPGLVSGMMDTTSTELRRIASSAPQLELDRRYLIGLLGAGTLFGLARAISVAQTTATEVNTASEDAINEELRQSPTVVSIEEIFYTKKDERVCPVCAPFHEQLLGDGDKRPPIHPNCRCERKYKITYSDGRVVIVRASEEAGNPIQIR